MKGCSLRFVRQFQQRGNMSLMFEYIRSCLSAKVSLFIADQRGTTNKINVSCLRMPRRISTVCYKFNHYFNAWYCLKWSRLSKFALAKNSTFRATVSSLIFSWSNSSWFPARFSVLYAIKIAKTAAFRSPIFAFLFFLLYLADARLCVQSAPHLSVQIKTSPDCVTDLLI